MLVTKPTENIEKFKIYLHINALITNENIKIFSFKEGDHFKNGR